MARRTVDHSKKDKGQRSKAGKAAEKTSGKQPSTLALRLGFALILVFLALFLVLNMLKIHAVLLDLLGSVFKGLVGYGFWVLPAAFLYIAWMLAFLHREPIRLRISATACAPVVLGALIHTGFCRADLDSGFGLVKSLWTTGKELSSGGVLAGLISEGLRSLISRGGTIPLLLVVFLVLVFLMFRISAAKLVHGRAEARRQRQTELEPDEPEPEPVTYDTRADLRVLVTPLPRQRTREEREDRGRKPRTQSQKKAEPGADPLFGKGRNTGAPEQPADIFDTRRHDYTAEVQEMVRQEQTDIQDDLFRTTAEREDMDPVSLAWNEPVPALPAEMDMELEPFPVSPEETEQEPKLTEADLEVVKEQKVSHGEAEEAAAQVAMEIEARTDEEAQEKPVYQYPPMSMLAEARGSEEDNTEEMRTNVRRLEETLESFGVDSKISNVVRGPAVTRYEMELKPGVKMSKITSLHEDIALSLGVSGVHVAAVPGKSSTIGIEVPNSIVTSVPIKEVLSSKEFRTHKSVLAFAAGKDISGNYIIGDIAKMPHLLIAGTTGSGKSVCMNSIIVSLLYRDSPEQCRLIMIDPKVVELSIYNGVPHLLIPVVTDPKKAAGALQWAVTEMDRRYKRFEDARVRDLEGFNKKALSDPELEPMPRIVVIIDELADLMMVAAKEVETSIARLAAKARAAGMHLVIATQRPSADVITGVIKANIPSRIAFAVSSAMESNIIMGTRGAEKLLGKGDMFYSPQGANKPRRVQGCFISDEEAEKVAEFVKASSEADYSQEILQEIEENAVSAEESESQITMEETVGDPLLPDAVEVILDTKQASTSMLQRRLKLGYAHAARIIDEMEEKGIVGPFEGSKPRQLLITREQWNAMVGINPNAAPETEETETDEDE